MKEIETILKKWHPNPRAAVWNCHGTWVAYHKALELIAQRAKITFEPPQIIEADAKNKTAVIAVTGRMSDPATTEWSIGEAAPYNNKNGYPYAMAEKRAKDRVILKLIGLHGEVYSEEEADAFKATGNEVKSITGHQGPLKRTELKAAMTALSHDLRDCLTVEMLDEIVEANSAVLEQCEIDLPEWFFGKDDILGAERTIAEKREELRMKAAA